jgi:hypothetical protein
VLLAEHAQWALEKIGFTPSLPQARRLAVVLPRGQS